MLGRRTRFTAVLAGVVLALTGFSGHGHGHKSGGDGGGGCSNSHKSNGGSSYRHTDDDDYGSTGGSGRTSTPTPTPTASGAPAGTVVTCVSPTSGSRAAVTSATVRVTADPQASDNRRYRLQVDFLGAADERVDSGSVFVTLDAGQSREVEVPMEVPTRVAEVRGCRLVQVMEWS
ncbi:hypothetical protein [Streptomyces crystallinus]|uniref:Secreted protein n=1 Tax=Streptomyces crystallinus TaxID=68191 RepID=A0ABP3R0P1_9ACTN